MKIKVLIAVVLCMAVLAGCSEKKVDLSRVIESTVGVNADGSIDEVIIEPFEQSYYSLEELQAYVDEEVAEFNQANPQEQPENQKADDEEITAVTVQSVEVDEEGKTARLALGYLTDDLYNAFNESNVQFLSMEEAAADTSISGITDFVSTKQEETKAFSDFAESAKLHVVCTDAPMRIQTSGKIMYYSKEVSLIDDHTVQTSEGLSVIVFK